MFRSYRCIVLALVGIALSYPVTKQAYAQTRTAEDKGKTKDQVAPPPRPSVEDYLARIASAMETGRSDPKTKASEYRADSDLKAQQDMARYALWMFLATAMTVALTGLGILLIWRTLIHTRRASKYAGVAARQARRAAVASDIMAKEASNSTMAAIAAADAGREANEIAKSSRRPWLTISVEPFDTVTFTSYGMQFDFLLTIKNVGASPATGIHTDHETVPGPTPIETSVAFFEVSFAKEKRHGAGTVLIPGETYSMRIMSALPRKIFPLLHHINGKPVMSPDVLISVVYRSLGSEARHQTAKGFSLIRGKEESRSAFAFFEEEGDVPINMVQFEEAPWSDPRAT